jgi:transposase
VGRLKEHPLANRYLYENENTIIAMKGVSYITDSRKRLKAVQIEISTLEKYEEQIEDLLERIIASARKGEPASQLSEVKKRLKKKGKF